jgi:hypothetical protein
MRFVVFLLATSDPVALSEPQNQLPNAEWEGTSPVSGIDKASADPTAQGALSVRQHLDAQITKVCCGIFRAEFPPSDRRQYSGSVLRLWE